MREGGSISQLKEPVNGQPGQEQESSGEVTSRPLKAAAAPPHSEGAPLKHTVSHTRFTHTSEHCPHCLIIRRVASVPWFPHLQNEKNNNNSVARI